MGIISKIETSQVPLTNYVGCMLGITPSVLFTSNYANAPHLILQLFSVCLVVWDDALLRHCTIFPYPIEKMNPHLK